MKRLLFDNLLAARANRTTGPRGATMFGVDFESALG
jgi:hypothetical protein